MKRYFTRPRGRPAPSPDDLAEKECIDAAVEAAIGAIKPWVQSNPARTLKSLRRAELESLVWAAVGAWIAKRSALEAAMQNNAIDDIWR